MSLTSYKKHLTTLYDAFDAVEYRKADTGETAKLKLLGFSETQCRSARFQTGKPSRPVHKAQFALKKRGTAYYAGLLAFFENYPLQNDVDSELLLRAKAALLQYFKELATIRNADTDVGFAACEEQRQILLSCLMGVMQAVLSANGETDVDAKALREMLDAGQWVANWERMRSKCSGVLVTTHSQRGMLHYQVEELIFGRLTQQQKDELNAIDINEKNTWPLWFQESNKLKQHYLYNNRLDIIAGRYPAPPLGSKRKLPHASNFRHHHSADFKVTQHWDEQTHEYQDKVELLNHYETLGVAIAEPISLKNSEARQQGAEMMAAQISDYAAACATRSTSSLCRDKLFAKEFTKFLKQRDIRPLHLESRKLSPIIGLDWLITRAAERISWIKDYSDNNRRLNANHHAAFEKAQKQPQSVQFLYSNWPINSERAFSRSFSRRQNQQTRDALYQYAGKFLTAMQEFLLQKTSNQGAAQELAQHCGAAVIPSDGSISYTGLNALIQYLENNPDAYQLFHGSADDMEPDATQQAKARFSRFVIGLHALYDYHRLWQQHSKSTVTNKQLFASGLERLIVCGFGGVASSGCKSAVDRLQADFAQTETMVAYYHSHAKDGNHQLPQFDATGDALDKYETMFARNHGSGHYQKVAEIKGYGVEGLVEGKGLIAKTLKKLFAIELPNMVSQRIRAKMSYIPGYPALSTKLQNKFGKLGKIRGKLQPSDYSVDVDASSGIDEIQTQQQWLDAMGLEFAVTPADGVAVYSNTMLNIKVPDQQQKNSVGATTTEKSDAVIKQSPLLPDGYMTTVSFRNNSAALYQKYRVNKPVLSLAEKSQQQRLALFLD